MAPGGTVNGPGEEPTRELDQVGELRDARADLDDELAEVRGQAASHRPRPEDPASPAGWEQAAIDREIASSKRQQAADRQEAAWDGTRHWLSGRRRRWNAGGRWRTAAWPPGTVPRERAAAALEQARRLRVRAWWVQNRLIDHPERRQDQ
jgi:hypothetical protein